MIRPSLFTCALAVAVLAVAGCGGGDSKPAACVSTSDAALVAAARAHVRNIDVGPDTSGEPDGRSARRVSVEACKSSDDAGRATVTVVGLHHKYISDVRHMLVMERRDDAWRIASDGDSYRCREGHGQGDFEPKPCVRGAS